MSVLKCISQRQTRLICSDAPGSEKKNKTYLSQTLPVVLHPIHVSGWWKQTRLLQLATVINTVLASVVYIMDTQHH